MSARPGPRGGLTGPICARALKSLHLLELRPRGHHDWPIKLTTQEVSSRVREQQAVEEGPSTCGPITETLA